MRKALFIFAVLAIALSALSNAVFAADDNHIKNLCAGDRLMPLPAIIQEGSTLLLPARCLFEAFGADVSWNGSTSEVTFRFGAIAMKARQNSRIVIVNDTPVVIGSAVKSINGSTYVPSCLLTDVLGAIPEERDDAIVYINELYGEINAEYNLEKLFPSSPVMCLLKAGATLYESIGGKALKSLEQETSAELLMDRNYSWYRVMTEDGFSGWVVQEDIVIDDSYEINRDILSNEEIETYADIKKFSSDTHYFAWVDISRQKVYILQKASSGWKLHKTMDCATGSNKSPTTRGIFKAADRGVWFYNPLFGSGAKYWVRFYGTYLFHSISLDEKQQVKDATLGERVSSGCIRLSLEDSSWIYHNLLPGTTVFIN